MLENKSNLSESFERLKVTVFAFFQNYLLVEKDGKPGQPVKVLYSQFLERVPLYSLSLEVFECMLLEYLHKVVPYERLQQMLQSRLPFVKFKAE